MGTKTLTLADFLLARIAEDEALARRVQSPVAAWAGGVGPHELWSVFAYDDEAEVPRGSVEATVTRVLAEVQAKRRIVADRAHHERFGIENDDHDAEMVAQGLYDAMVALASPYADHADFREEWKP